MLCFPGVANVFVAPDLCSACLKLAGFHAAAAATAAVAAAVAAAATAATAVDLVLARLSNM